MLRLLGFSFVYAEPLRGGFLRLGDVTVLTGRNDSGKTRLLRLIESALACSQTVESVDLFGIASAAEVADQIDEEAGDASGIEEFGDALGEFRDGLELDGDERRVGVRIDGSRRCAWRFGRSPAELGEPACEEVLWRLPLAAGSGDPSEPVKLEHLGEPSRSLLPEGVVVPSAADAVVRDVGWVVWRLARVFQELAGERVAYGVRGVVLEEIDESFLLLSGSGPAAQWRSWRWLVAENRQRSTVEPATIRACAAVERIANRLLPAFIAREYRLEVRAAQPTEIASGRFVALRLMRRDTQDPEHPPDVVRLLVSEQEDEEWWSATPNDAALRFGIDEAPDGFAVWLQLAIREALARVKVISYSLELAVRRLEQIHRDADHADDDWEDGEESEDSTGQLGVAFEVLGLGQVRERVRERLAYLEEPSLLAPAVERIPADERLGPIDCFDAPEVADLFELPRTRVYLIDEPEQRLHPGLQRQAARWLRSVMREWGAQCVVATHALAFIDLPDTDEVYELSREGQHVDIRPLDVGELTAHTPIARAIGWDRGEMLARYRLFALLNPQLAATFEELADEQLDRARIRLVPCELGGEVAVGLMSILSQVTLAPICVVTRSAERDALVRLLDATDERTMIANQDGELAGIVRLLTLARRNDRVLDVFTIDDSLMKAAGEHDELASDPSTARGPESVGDLHHDVSPLPASLVDLLWQLEQRALTGES